jgi:uncharacterized membrane protein YraQ (UPF0718 family)
VNGSLERYRLLAAVLAADLALAAIRWPLAWAAARNTAGFLLDVLAVVPAVMILVALIDAWLPRATVEAHLGDASGLRGLLLAIVLGTAAAGPLYAAFPVGSALKAKGARTASIATFLGAWGTIKVPMVLLESSYLGLRFALLRLALTLPGVLAVGLLTEWLTFRLGSGRARTAEGRGSTRAGFHQRSDQPTDHPEVNSNVTIRHSRVVPAECRRTSDTE